MGPVRPRGRERWEGGWRERSSISWRNRAKEGAGTWSPHVGGHGGVEGHPIDKGMPWYLFVSQ